MASINGSGEPPSKRARVDSGLRVDFQAPLPNADDADWLLWAERWVSWDPNPETKKTIQDHVTQKSTSELRKILGSRLEFGTAGLRGAMGSGSNQMNDLVVLQSTQGVAAYLERVFGAEGKDKGVCVGFDHRQRGGCNSRSFALYTAAVLLHKGFKVYLYKDIVATPMVPWCMEQKGCCAGVMITASHNPKEDNGYKLYWSNGAQIVPPHDAEIAKLIEENLEPWKKYDVEKVYADPRCISDDDAVIDAYFERLKSVSCFMDDNRKMAKDFRITYTAMHGVGHRFVQKAFDAFGHGQSNMVDVTAQNKPDPTFPTVAFPNPEEGKGALKLACSAAEAAGSSLILANDPDADRLAVAERSASGGWHIFTGNELGSLLGHWAWRCWRKKNPTKSPSKVYMIASAVSSKFLASVAKKEGFQFVETLTGFKWMGSKTAELRAAGYEVIFSFEEAIGFCFGDMVKDKDGVAAAAIFAEMAKQFKKEGKTCLQALQELYETYGHFTSLNSYVKCMDPAKTTQIFAKQRANTGLKGYRKDICGVVITGVRDLTEGYYYDSRRALTCGGRPELPMNIGGEMITYYFGNCEAQVTLRTSGTEPKIKWYSEMRTAAGGEAARIKLSALVRMVVGQLLDPDTNKLEIRPEDMDFFAGR